MTKTSRDFKISRIVATDDNGVSVFLKGYPTKQEFEFENYVTQQHLELWFGSSAVDGLKVGQIVRLTLNVVGEAK